MASEEATPADLIAYKWAETLSTGAQSTLLGADLKRLSAMIAAAIDGPPATAETCVKCGHANKGKMEYCAVCGCKCEFAVPTAAMSDETFLKRAQEENSCAITASSPPLVYCPNCKSADVGIAIEESPHNSHYYCRECTATWPVALTAAGAADLISWGEVRHPEDYCHRCGGPNISWYAPSLLWNQFVRDKGQPAIICPICFAELAREANVTWSVVPDVTTSDYDERLAVRAAQRIINATIQSEEEAMVIVRDALAQSAAALAAARPAPDLEAVARRAAEKIQVRYLPDHRTAYGVAATRHEIAAIILEELQGDL